jgi:hypothetical protein
VFIVRAGTAGRATSPRAASALPADAEDVAATTACAARSSGARRAAPGVARAGARPRRSRDGAAAAGRASCRVETRAARETDPALKADLDRLLAAALRRAPERRARWRRRGPAHASEPAVRALLRQRLGEGGEADPEIAARCSARSCRSRRAWPGASAWASVHRRQPRLDPAARRARPRDHATA